MNCSSFFYTTEPFWINEAAKELRQELIKPSAQLRNGIKEAVIKVNGGLTFCDRQSSDLEQINDGREKGSASFQLSCDDNIKI